MNSQNVEERQLPSSKKERELIYDGFNNTHSGRLDSKLLKISWLWI